MTETVWEMPISPTAITRGPAFIPLSRRRCELSYYVEAEIGDQKKSLIFDGVEAYKCTYRASLSADMIKAAYGKLVDLGRSQWLIEINQKSDGYYTKVKKIPPTLRHLAICFDDGPCFEIICATFNLPQ